MSQVFLKVKIKSIAVEARIIRLEERKAKAHRRWLAQHTANNDPYAVVDATDSTFWKLRRHREELGVEARASLIAYGFMRNRAYLQIENKCHEEKCLASTSQKLLLNAIVRNLQKFGYSSEFKADELLKIVMDWAGYEQHSSEWCKKKVLLAPSQVAQAAE